MTKMATEDRNERDLILAPNEYALVSDATKGSIDCYVGPFKTSLAGTDRCVVFDGKTKRFRAVAMQDGIQLFQTAPEGFYATLKNAAEGDKHPTGSGKMTTPQLRIGKKVNIAGPASFALWPGQMSKVIQGHNLRSNEYLLVRVYDEEAARQNWHNAIIKTQESTDTNTLVSDTKHKKTQILADTPKGAVDLLSEKDLTMGKLFVIKGTDVSFYIPSTGIEVVPEYVNNETRYVREAVTLELLEYCLLLDQDGTKRYVHGPAVVFPRPTEKFVEAPIKSNPDKAKAKKFRAQELTQASGIHIRVIADYVEDDGTVRKAGDELFITGEKQTIYFPRKEHAVIKYGEQDVHFGIAIPLGESRYVLDRNTGAIRIVAGPQIFLPDPRKEVIINRALPLKLVDLMYPGNAEALEINAARLGVDDQDIMSAGGAEAFLNNSTMGDSMQYQAAAACATPDTTRRIMIKGASKTLPGDAFDRKNKFTAPRSIVLNTKYDGAVNVTLWTGYAALLVRKNGDRRVVQGPGTFTLEYDETPQVITLSSGKPKNTDNMMKTVFLLTTANKVSDIIEVETKDFCRLNVKVSYRVNFEGDPNRWFNVDNYVKFLCDHERSRIRAAVQKLSIEEFYGNHTDLLRDIVLGLPTASDKDMKTKHAKSGRPGTAFEENGMRIYDVEVLGVQMQNADVEKMLVGAQRDVIQNALVLQSERRKLSYVKEFEDLKRQTALAQSETKHSLMDLQMEDTKRKLAVDLAALEANATTQAQQIAKELETEKSRDEIATVARARGVADHEAQNYIDEKAQALKLKELEAQVQAVVDKAKAISPDLIAALNCFGERAMVEKVAESMAPLGILSGGKKSVVEILQEMLKGTVLAQQLGSVINEKPATKSRG